MYITIIEDDQKYAQLLQKKLEKEGFFVKLFFSYESFILAPSLKSDFFLIDISLGDSGGNGFDIINFLRKKKKLKTPIIITSSFNDKEKKIYGLDLGADDYITKIFSTDELIARIRAVTRRQEDRTFNSILNHKDITLNMGTKRLTVSNKEIYLTNLEIRLLHFFLCNKGKIITKFDLISSVWGHYDLLAVSDNTINVTISKLRKKIGKSFDLITKINQGYLLEN